MPEPLVPPGDESELMDRAQQLAGMTLLDLARQTGQPLPAHPRRAKGWIGQTVERALGATGACRAVPDFPALCIELKTLPVDRRGRPRESTFVCTVDLTEIGDIEWESSRVRRKLARVLWVPVESEQALDFAARHLGHPLLWSPSPQEEAGLRSDWEELAGRIGRGELETVTGHMGRCLQVRPKAMNSSARRRSFDQQGAPSLAMPRGFYLRATFTHRIL